MNDSGTKKTKLSEEEVQPPQSSSNSPLTEPYIPKAPYPNYLDIPPPFGKKGAKMEEMMEIFKQVKINLPFVEVIKQIPSYAKFLKDLCTQKCNSRTHVSKKIFLTE